MTTLMEENDEYNMFMVRLFIVILSLFSNKQLSTLPEFFKKYLIMVVIYLFIGYRLKLPKSWIVTRFVDQLVILFLMLFFVNFN